MAIIFLPGNRKFERGQDNKLIIWSKGHDAAFTSSNQTIEATPPRLPYQRLLTRTPSSTPDCNLGDRRVSSSVAEEPFPYQKLVRAVPSVGCGHVAETADVGINDAGSGEAHQKAYQSLSLQRNPLVSCYTLLHRNKAILGAYKS